MATDKYLQHFHRGVALVSGRLTTVNGSNPTILQGKGFTAARTGEGTIRITLTTDPLPMKILAVIAGYAPETLTNELHEVWVDQDSITNKIFDLVTVINADTSGGASAADDDPGSEIHFICAVQIYGSPAVA